MTTTRILLLPALFLLFLTACQPTSGPMTRPEISIETIAAEQSGNLAEAAAEYMQLAEKASAGKQAAYYLRAAQLYDKLEQPADAKNALSKVDSAQLSGSQRVDVAKLKAKVAIAEQDGEAALKAIADIDLSQVSGDDHVALLQLQAQAYAVDENWLEQTNTHLKIDKLLSDEDALTKNREALWQSLMQLTPQALDLFNPGTPPDQDSGWFALAYAMKAYKDNPEAQEVALENWRRSYPSHPADPDKYQSAVSFGLGAGVSLPEQVGDVAVLLPAAGHFVEAAKTIKAGIIAAHEASGSSTKLHFLDVSTDTLSGRSNAIEAYNEAINRGAKLVIGPLEKQAVEALAKASDLPVPVLALNRIDARLSRPNLYQFGLAPEDDASAIAEYGEQKGYQRAVILSPRNDWGDRIANAFSEEWRELGGTVLQRSTYQESENDFRNTLIPLLGVDESEIRAAAARHANDRSVNAEPKPRQDIDFIFLVARPLKARQLVTQLRFHYSGDIPLLATSHAYTGQPDPQQNIDLNGLVIADIPWMFEANAIDDPAYQSLKQHNERNFGSLLRLYAMGTDAYRLVSQLSNLSRDPAASYPGATGTLQINQQGQVERDMSYGQFRNGLLVLTN